MVYLTYDSIDDAGASDGRRGFRGYRRRQQQGYYCKTSSCILFVAVVGYILLILPGTILASSTTASNVSSSTSSSLSPSWFWKKEWNIWSLFRNNKVLNDEKESTNKLTTNDESGNQTNNNIESNNSNNKEESQSILKQLTGDKQTSTTKDDSRSNEYYSPVDSYDDDDERNSNKDTSIWNTSPIMTLKRTQFLDRIAILASSIMRKDMSILDMDRKSNNNDLNYKYKDIDLDGITPQSDLTLPGRHIHIVTTAALPWFTGTAVNPLLRAAYLHRKTQEINQKHGPVSIVGNTNGINETQTSSSTTTTTKPRRWVTLVIPWLELPEDQIMLYNGRVFNNCTEQEQYIRHWLHHDANMSDVACTETGLEILFYPGRYHPGLGSIFAMGDIIDTIVNSTIVSSISNNETSTNNETINGVSNVDGSGSALIPRPLDVCVLEEPEHCNWYRAPGDGWTKRFSYVVGIVHTNYKEYASSHYSGLWTAPAIALMSSAMIRAYCHKVIKLSNTLQSYAVEKESTSNVHGVRSNFWQEGLRRSKSPSSSWGDNPSNTTSIYFIGKLLWAKGLDLMLELEDYYKQYTGDYFPIDIYGSGPDERAIIRAFHGRRNSVNANPKKEAEIEAMDKDDDDDETMDESCDWDKRIETHDKSTATVEVDDMSEENFFWSKNNGNDFYVMAKQKIAQLKATIDMAVDIHEMTKEHIAKIKDTINSVELPTTFAELRRQPIPAKFPGRVDHGTLTNYRIFFNPSISEVLCTTTAEALAMGKYAIIPVHPSNTFFLQFPNCLAYRNKFEFVANLRWALTHDPEPLTEEQIHQFTWEAATERFIAASAITWREALERERLGLAKLDERIAWFHNEIGKGETGDFLRKVLGAGPASHQVKYQKEKYVVGSSSSQEVKDGEGGDSLDEDEETGFSDKFRRSSFAQAIRAAVKDFSSFGIQ